LDGFINQQNICTHSRTSINISALNSELFSHLDCHFVNTLIGNLINGCDIGYTGPQFTHHNNLYSAYQQPTILDTTIAEECKAEQVLGPFEEPPLSSFHSSGLGLVPKHDGAGKPYMSSLCPLWLQHQ